MKPVMTLKELKEKLYYSVPELDGPDFDDILEQIIQLQREKELSELTDEVIEMLISEKFTNGEGWDDLDRLTMEKGAKALRDHLKQNNPRPQSEISSLTDEQIKTIIQQERDKNPLFNKYQLSFQVAKRIINQVK